MKSFFDALDRSGDSFYVAFFILLVVIGIADRVLASRWSR